MWRSLSFGSFPEIFICTVLLVPVTLECTDIFINKTSNCTFVPHKNGVIRLKRLNTLELCDEDKGQVTRGREAGIIIARETDAQTGGLKRSEACWVQIITLGGQKCMVSLWTDKIVQKVSNKLGLGGTFVLIDVLLDVFMITVLDLTAAGERAHLFPLFTTPIPQILVWSAVRYLQWIN